MDICVPAVLIKEEFPHTLVYSIAIIIFCPIVVILNTILIITFIATKEALKNTSNLLIMCISFADLLFGAAVMPLFVYTLNNIDRKDICNIASVVLVALGTLGSINMMQTTLLAIDRYHHMNPNIQNRPTLLRKAFKISNVGYIVMAEIIVAFSFAGLSLIYLTSKNIVLEFLGPVEVLGGIMYVSIVTCLYVKGYKRIRTFTDENPVYHETGEQPSYIKNLYKTVLVLVLLAYVSYLPFCITQGIGYIIINTKMTLLSSAAFAYFNEISYLVLYSSYFTNCLVVLYFNKKANAWLFRKFRIHINTDEIH